jgi:hypothetical protein
MVAGTRLASDGSSTATVWTSPDGSAWRSTALTGPQVDSESSAAIDWRNATIVVGSVGRGTDRRAAAWIAPTPGAAFVQIAGGGLGLSGSAMTSVSGGPLGLFAAGTVDGRVAMWYSTNGQRWTRLAGAEHVIDAANDPHVTTLASGMEGGIFAAGWERSGASTVAAVWSSGDGINWRPVSAPAAFAGVGDHVITALAPFGTGLVAVGGSRAGTRWTPASWISPNGDSWSEPSTHFALGARSQPDSSDAIVRDLSAVATGLHSATLTAVGGGPTAQRVWVSTDGLHWVESSLPARAAASTGWEASRVAVAGSTLAIADAEAGQPHLLVRRPTGWLEPSSRPATFGAVQAVARPVGLVSSTAGLLLAVQINHSLQVLGPGSSSVAFFGSADGTTWTPMAATGSFADSEIEAVTAQPAGFVAVGWRQVGDYRRATVWTSGDGRSWSLGAPLDSPPVVTSDVATGVCIDGTVIAVVGQASRTTGGAAPRAWVSGDGVHWTLATVGPPALAGTSITMAGCAAIPTGPAGAYRMEAFGAVSGSGSSPAPAYWTGVGTTVWTRQTIDPFGSSFPFPVLDLSRRSTLWLAAIGNPDAAVLPGGNGSGGPSTLWRSVDSGASWQRLDTSGAPWVGAEPVQIGRVAWLASSPVVAGVIDGRLAVWTGIPTS